MNPFELNTARLTLRRPALADAPRIAEIANDVDVARMTTQMPHPYSLHDAHDWLEGMNVREASDDLAFAITLPSSLPIGVIGLHRVNAGHAPEIGYWIGKPWWGEGFATEALSAVLDWCRNQWGQRWIASGHFADNPASGNVLCKAGFLYTGVVENRFSRARGCKVATRKMVWLA